MRWFRYPQRATSCTALEHFYVAHHHSNGKDAKEEEDAPARRTEPIRRARLSVQVARHDGQAGLEEQHECELHEYHQPIIDGAAIRLAHEL